MKRKENDIPNYDDRSAAEKSTTFGDRPTLEELEVSNAAEIREMETFAAAEGRRTAEEIERLIDACGLHDVLCIVADICREKAEHIQANWQDEGTARSWEEAARAVDKATARVRFLL